MEKKTNAKKFYISMNEELYNRMAYVAKKHLLSIHDMLKMANFVNLKLLTYKDWDGPKIKVSYYAKERLPSLNVSNINYKIEKLLKIFADNFNGLELKSPEML